MLLRISLKKHTKPLYPIKKHVYNILIKFCTSVSDRQLKWVEKVKYDMSRAPVARWKQHLSPQIKTRLCSTPPSNIVWKIQLFYYHLSTSAPNLRCLIWKEKEQIRLKYISHLHCVPCVSVVTSASAAMLSSSLPDPISAVSGSYLSSASHSF